MKNGLKQFLYFVLEQHEVIEFAIDIVASGIEQQDIWMVLSGCAILILLWIIKFDIEGHFPSMRFQSRHH